MENKTDKILENKTNKILIIVYLALLLSSPALGHLWHDWVFYLVFILWGILLPLGLIILLILYRRKIAGIEIKKKVPLLIMSVVFIIAITASSYVVMICVILGHC